MMNAMTGDTVPPAVSWDAELVRVYTDRYDDLVRLAYLLTGQAAIAEEIVQDSFLAAHHRIHNLHEPFAYVRTSVVNGCYSWGRRKRLETERRPPPPDPAHLVADELRDALAGLPFRNRAAIVLRYYADLPESRIAEILDCRPATVRTLIRRGLQSLRKVIDQ
jgi:RNA polymerase sigma factor (sigma-70 family)